MRKMIAVAVFALGLAGGSIIATAETGAVGNGGSSYAAVDAACAGTTSASIFLGASTVVADSPAGGAVATPGPASLVLLGIGLLSMIGAIRRRFFRA